MPNPNHRRRLATLAATATTVLLAVSGTAGAGTAPADTHGDAGWVLSTTDTSTGYAPTFVGNGYLAARIPAAGAGYATTPIVTQSALAGFYASSSPDAGETRASLPAWTTLGVGDGTTVVNATEPHPCDFDTLCAAPYGQLSGGAVLASDHSGSTSGQFVAGFATNSLAPNVGATATVTLHGASAGAARVGVRYANSTGATQTGTVVVNGVSTQVSLPSLPTWDTWAVVSVAVTLSAGDNTIAVTTADGDTGRFNLDAVTAYPTDATAPTTASGAAGTMSHYRQSLDMRTGTLTTGYDWTSAGGRTMHLVYTVNVDQGSTHQGSVTLAITPAWSGTATVYDQFDARGLDHATTRNAAVDAATATMTEDAVTSGELVTATLASALRVDGRTVRTTRTGDLAGGTVGQQAALTVQAGRTYSVTKFVGVASSVDTDRTLTSATPRQVATGAAAAGARSGTRAVAAQNAAAWAALWKSDISVPGDSTLTASVRAAMFYLLESTRAGVDFSTSPGGLSSDGYNGHVFWDADTWMYPGLLAQHPAIANTMNTYRQQRLAAARTIAAYEGHQGAKFPWESALTGAESIPPGNPENLYENHIDSDVALAQWQYYLATGDRTWLRTRGYPVLKGVADYWASRAVRNSDGSYSLPDVQGPDEYHVPVDDEAYTNVSARTALTIATTAARLVKATPAAAWTTVAQHLRMPTVDPATGAHREYDGYTAGTVVKQADVTMLQYPWNYPMSRATKVADLEYYGRNTDVGGPSMTDSVAAIDSASLGLGCSAYTYLLRSSTPFLTTPFDQMQETRTGGAFTFTTAEGGYLQEFLYGFTGMRFGSDAVTLDPSLPPQLPGVDLTGLHWHGRTFDLHVRHGYTTVRLTSGSPLPVTVDGHTRSVRRNATTTLTTRALGAPTSADRALCAKATASSADPSYPAVAAVDGASATAWHATSGGATLTLDLGARTTLHTVTVTSDGATTPYTVQSSTDGSTWSTVGTQDAAAGSMTVVGSRAFTARYLRYVAGNSAAARITAITAS